MSALSDLIATFINGNLTDAKQKAKRYNHRRLREAYADATGCTTRTACAAADYLKGLSSFEEYCQIKHDEK